mmetsp:Transcript_17965/g.24704  ORF Transcript_17965/g.24704 Transcript_17965/m.24704 type:complete len:577 (-) Transcript_17965:277-2007(-)
MIDGGEEDDEKEKGSKEVRDDGRVDEAPRPPSSVVEEADVRERHGHPVLVAGGDDARVRHRAPGLGDEFDANLGGVIDGVAEGEERVRTQGHAVQRRQPGGLLLLRERLGHALEVGLPHRPLGGGDVALDVPHARVHLVLALDAGLEGQAHDLGVLPQPPDRHLPAGQLHTVHAALLARAHAHHLPRAGEAHAVALRVLERDRGQQQVPPGVLRQGARPHVLQVLLGQHHGVARLHEAHAQHLAVLLGGGHVGGVALQHDELAALLPAQDLQRGRLVARGDDPVADLPLEHQRGGLVDHVRDGHEVAEAAHGVGVARAQVGRGQRRGLDLANVVGHHLVGGQRHGQAGAGGRDVLEGGGGRLAEALLELHHQLPGVGGVQQVDVARRAVDGAEGHRAAAQRVDAGRLLVRVAPVLERGLVLVHPGGDGRLLAQLAVDPARDGRVVGGRERERAGGEPAAQRQRGLPLVLLHLGHQLRVLVRGRGDDHVLVVLRAGAQHAGPADVDVLDAVVEVRPAGHGLLEGVQVEHHQVDRLHAVGLAVGLVLGVAAHVQQAAVHLGVQGLHPSVHHFRGLGVL